MRDATGARDDERRPAALRFRTSPDTVARRTDDEYVLVQLQANRIYQLNRTGARLWELLEAGQDLQQAQEQMLVEFDVDEQQLRNEVNMLTDELVAKGLLEPEPDAGS